MILRISISKVEAHPRLDLKWSFPVNKDGPTHKEMRQQLQRVHGVEFVDMQRYGGTIGYAPHAVTPDELVMDIVDLFENNIKMVALYNQHDATREYGAAERIEVEAMLL